MKRNDDDHTCWCDDPAKPGHKLWLCGKEICFRLLNKKLPLPKLIALVDDEEK